MRRILQIFQFLFRLTLQVGDVPARLIKQTAGLRRAGMWVRENRIKGGQPDCGFSNPEGANSARSANRMLRDEIPRVSPPSSGRFNTIFFCLKAGVKRRQAASSGLKTIKVK